MKIAAPQYKNAESLGRENLSSVGQVASAVSAKGSADRALIDHTAKVGAEFIRREEKANFNNVLTDTKVEMDQWEEKNAVREFYDGNELKGRVDGVELTTKGTDQYGDEVDVPVKQIPAYKVYPQLLAKKLKGVMDANAQRILNPIDRQAYIESRQVYNADTVRAATLKSAKQQYNYQRQENDAKRKQALLSGDLGLADFLTKGYEGTEFEIKARLQQNREGIEVYQADELIRIEDVKGMTDFLNYLQDPQYEEKGGPLTERKNIDLQTRLKSNIGRLTVRGGAVDKLYKEETRRQGQDFLAAQYNGDIKTDEEITRMRAKLTGVELHRLSVDIRRATKIAPVVDAMKRVPASQYDTIIKSFSKQGITKGDEAKALSSQLQVVAAKMEKQIAKDGTGFYRKNVAGQRLVMGQKGYWAESVADSKQASNLYQVQARPLSDTDAFQLGKNFEFATTDKKIKFIEDVLTEVPEKADQDALFTQIDHTKNGNLNVYADMVQRGEMETIKAIEEGNQLREDKALGLVPKDLAANINIKLDKVFRLNSELVSYREAIMDYYAKLAGDDKKYNAEYYDEDFMDAAIKAVVGNVVEYDDRMFLLPTNDIDADGFEYWIDDIPLEYITQLGGVAGMDNVKFMQALRDGDLTLWPSTTRGEYLIRDISGGYLMTKDTSKGRPVNFTLIYDRNQQRDKSGLSGLMTRGGAP